MARNQKLTKVIQGRKITGTQSAGAELRITFDDCSAMTIQTGAQPTNLSTGGTIKAVRQQDTTLNLDLEDGGSLEITTAEATSSVLLRDKNNVLEYAD